MNRIRAAVFGSPYSTDRFPKTTAKTVMKGSLNTFEFRPSFKGLALLVLGLGILNLMNPLYSQPRNRLDTPEASTLSDEDAKALLESFRSYSYPDDYCFRFRVRHYPYRKKTVEAYGTLWGLFDPVTRTHYQRVHLEKRDPESPRNFLPIARFLFIRGPYPEVWTIDESGEPVSLDPEHWSKPLIEEMSVTVSDMLMPFLYWENSHYEGPSQVKARPAQSFLLSPPADSGGVCVMPSVRVAFDDEFKGLLQSEWLADDGSILRSIELVSLKKVQEQYIPRTMDYRDLGKRDKTRIDIQAAAMRVQFDSSVFVPSNLDEPPPLVPSSDFTLF